MTGEGKTERAPPEAAAAAEPAATAPAEPRGQRHPRRGRAPRTRAVVATADAAPGAPHPRRRGEQAEVLARGQRARAEERARIAAI